MKALFAIPGDISALTGGYAYDREVMKRAAAHGVALTHLALPGGFPAPSADEVRATLGLLRSAPGNHVLLIDGLAFGAFTDDLLDALPARTVALVHHPLALETGLSHERADALRESERRALARAAHVLTPSEIVKQTLVSDYAVAPTRISVATPGTARAPRAKGSGGPVHLLAVGAMTPRKGHDVLIEALAGLAAFDWRLTIVGSLARAPDYVAHVKKLVAAHGVSMRVTLAGEASEIELARMYDCADLFVLPSLYEGYGMVLGEAMARGLPIVTTTGGAAAETAPDSAALKVPPGDPAALAQALCTILGDPALRATMAQASWSAGQELPTWDDTARIVFDNLIRVAEGGTS